MNRIPLCKMCSGYIAKHFDFIEGSVPWSGAGECWGCEAKPILVCAPPSDFHIEGIGRGTLEGDHYEYSQVIPAGKMEEVVRAFTEIDSQLSGSQIAACGIIWHETKGEYTAMMRVDLKPLVRWMSTFGAVRREGKDNE